MKECPICLTKTQGKTVKCCNCGSQLNTPFFVELEDNIDLLNTMLADSNSQPPLYKPGPYWEVRARNAASEIRRCGIKDFRGSANLIGLSYTDNLFLDYRDAFNHGVAPRIAKLVSKTYPLC